MVNDAEQIQIKSRAEGRRWQEQNHIRLKETARLAQENTFANHWRDRTIP